jgi:cell wall-associated NlpC family hydrolase
MTPANGKPRRVDVLNRALFDLMRKPYLWGGKNPHTGCDCSGGFTYSLWKEGGIDLRGSHDTDALWATLPAVETDLAKPGDLALYGGTSDLDVEHLGILISRMPDGSWTVLTTTKGNRTTKSLADAKRDGARWVMRTTHLYRTDFRGFRSAEKYYAPYT